jgi:Family of unknown function (DUF6353)
MKFLPDGLSQQAGRTMLKLEMDSPRLLFGIGVASMIGSTVLACRATLKLEGVLETTQNDLEIANTLEHREYSEEDRQKDKTIIYSRAVVSISKLYGPSILLGIAGIGCLTKSHNILEQRNAALTAAYVALDKGFQKYRERVITKYGEADDQEFRYGAQKVPIEDEKTGRKKEVVRVSFDDPSIYARFFDQTSSSWSKQAEYNLFFLKCQQEYANHLLRSRGHVFLNEVYDSLGIQRSKAGAVVGWVLGNGDDFVDFNIFNPDDQSARDFVNGAEGAILLDFNVDGLIYQLISEDRVKWQD